MPRRKHAPARAERPCERGTGRTPRRARRRLTLTAVDTANDISRVPHLPAGQDHPGAGRSARLRPTAASPGLRREEVASLAGISVEYYTRLERGNVSGVSDSVLEASPRPAARRRRTRPPVRPRPHRRPDRPSHAQPHAPAQEAVRPAIQRILDQMADAGLPPQRPLRRPRRQRARPRPLRAAVRPAATQPANSARFVFLDPRRRRLLPRLGPGRQRLRRASCAPKRAATPTTATSPTSSASSPPAATSSARRWAAHDVRFHRTGSKRLHHPLVGDLDLDYESFELAGDPGQRSTSTPPHAGSTSAAGARPPRELDHHARPGGRSRGASRDATPVDGRTTCSSVHSQV